MVYIHTGCHKICSYELYQLIGQGLWDNLYIIVLWTENSLVVGLIYPISYINILYVIPEWVVKKIKALFFDKLSAKQCFSRVRKMFISSNCNVDFQSLLCGMVVKGRKGRKKGNQSLAAQIKLKTCKKKEQCIRHCKTLSLSLASTKHSYRLFPGVCVTNIIYNYR